MARPVRDSIVLERAKELKFDSIYLDNLSIYAGDVVSTQDKIKLDSTQFGMSSLSVTKRLSDKYESIKISEGDTYISIEKGPGDFQKIPATVDQIRMLKALAIEQINQNQEYSTIVSTIFYKLARQIYTGKGLGEFIEENNLTPMQSVVYKEFCEYIRKKLVGNGTLTIKA